MPRRSPYDVAFSTSAEPRLQPPPDLDDDARMVFVDIITTVRADHFTKAHLPLLCAYSRAVVLERVASKGLRDDGYVLRDGKASPWLALLAQASRQLTTLARGLRLSPASQHAPAPKEPPPPISYYDRMRLEHRDDEPGH